MPAAAPAIGAIAGSYFGGYVASAALAGTMIGASGFIVGMAVGRAVGSMVGSSLATSLFGEKPKLPDYSTPLEDRGLLQNIVGANEPIPVIYGLRRVGGTRVFAETSGTDNKYLHLVNVLGEGTIDQVTQIYLNDIAISDSKFSGEAATSEMSNVEVTKQVFRFRGNVDHILYIKVGCAEEGAPSYGGSGSSGTLESGAAAAGITYDESPSGYEGEGWHGDLSATISLTPYDSNKLSASKLHDAVLAVASKRGGSTVDIVQQPSTANNYEAIIKIYEPNGGEGYFDFTLTFREGSNAYADHFGGEYAEAWVHTGSDTQAADEELVASVEAWTSAHKLSGVAYLYARLKYDQDVFAGGIPVITADVKGVKVYDPRSASTAWSDNPALCLRDYLTNTRYGRAIPASMIDDTSFSAAANYCDDLVSKGGSSAKRYTLNGVVDTGRTSLEVVREMLTACRGMLVFSAGQYRLVIDKPESTGFAFTEDNILGAWTISLGDKTNTYNRIRANFFNPARSWQPDIATIDSTALRTLDNGLMLEREISLPFTSDEATAKQIATINLNQSRQQILTEFTATVAGIRCEVGDVVTVTHSTPGWASKKFRVLRMALQNNDEVRITALEYDETVYDFGTIAVTDASPNTNLPNPYSVETPTNLSVSESLYVTRDGAGVKAKASLQWEMVDDAFVSLYQIEYRITNGSSWIPVGTTYTSEFDVLDINPGTYSFRVRAVNSFGVHSEWVSVQKQISGLSDPPAAITGLQIQAVSSLAVLIWNQAPELDVKIGGSIEIRHQNVLSGATWGNSLSVGKALPGSATTAVLPLEFGTYLIRAKDSSGLNSNVVSITTKAATVQAFSQVGQVLEVAPFTGSFSDTEDTGSVLKLTQSEEAGVTTSGEYLFSAGIDAGTVKRQRLIKSITSAITNEYETIDRRDEYMDTWVSFDSIDDATGDCQIYVRHTDDDPSGSPTWSAWELLTVNEYSHRAFEFKAALSVSTNNYNIRVSSITITSQEPS